MYYKNSSIYDIEYFSLFVIDIDIYIVIDVMVLCVNVLLLNE